MKQISRIGKIILSKPVSMILILSTCSFLKAATDEQKEQFFHQTYLRFNTKPTPESTWNSMLQRVQVNVYMVQEGDTLWDLSQTLFADPHFWPKIWAMNADKIYNPHQISPDQEILFYPGSADLPPSLGPAESKAAISQARPKRIIPVVSDLPPSFPGVRFPVRGNDKEDVKDSLLMADDFFSKPNLDQKMELSAYYSDVDLSKNIDEVVDTENGFKSGGTGDFLYVRLSNPSQKIYHVVKSMVIHGQSSRRFIKVFGQIRVVSKAKNGENIYKAVIENAIDLPQVGHKLLSGEIPLIEVPAPGKMSAVESRIIGGQNGDNKLIAPGSFLFLDSGSSSGLGVGDLLPIFSNPNLRTGSTYLDMNFKKIGIAQVVNVEATGSTAYLINSNDDVRVGDLSGALGKENLEEDQKNQ
ncbi:MAG: LysM peptidoglycan-binding domain-containing protein [Pseudobdellovibrionaceae bacterium]|jgi:hypothetical protein